MCEAAHLEKKREKKDRITDDGSISSNIPHMVYPGGRLKVEHLIVRVRWMCVAAVLNPVTYVNESRIECNHNILTAD